MHFDHVVLAGVHSALGISVASEYNWASGSTGSANSCGLSFLGQLVINGEVRTRLCSLLLCFNGGVIHEVCRERSKSGHLPAQWYRLNSWLSCQRDIVLRWRVFTAESTVSHTVCSFVGMCTGAVHFGRLDLYGKRAELGNHPKICHHSMAGSLQFLDQVCDE